MPKESLRRRREEDFNCLVGGPFINRKQCLNFIYRTWPKMRPGSLGKEKEVLGDLYTKSLKCTCRFRKGVLCMRMLAVYDEKMRLWFVLTQPSSSKECCQCFQVIPRSLLPGFSFMKFRRTIVGYETASYISKLKPATRKHVIKDIISNPRSEKPETLFVHQLLNRIDVTREVLGNLDINSDAHSSRTYSAETILQSYVG
mmetsp:Transcript_4437/g.5141  ORF Transcript_4437/g.5141 Transcript_4437/m.5141 type:complete len:200 (-) Transcript_4437:1032-1631(-)